MSLTGYSILLIEPPLTTALIKASANDSHLIVREAESMRELLWLWIPYIVDTIPPDCDDLGLMVSYPGGETESVVTKVHSLSNSLFHASGQMQGAQNISFELRCKGSADGFPYKGKLTLAQFELKVVILDKDTSANVWLAPLTYLAVDVTKGDPILYDGIWWKFVKWNGGHRGQVTLADTTRVQICNPTAKLCKRIIKRAPINKPSDNEDSEVQSLSSLMRQLFPNDNKDSEVQSLTSLVRQQFPNKSTDLQKPHTY